MLILTGCVLSLVCCSSGDHGDSLPIPQTGAYSYEVPVSSDSPWPQMRRTRYNNGRSPIEPVGSGEPWAFETDKGIFSTPVIGHDGTILVGSADRSFYAIHPDGTEKWRFPTGEIIDSAAAVAEDGTIYFPSGDGNIYALTPEGGEIWRFGAHHAAGDPGAGDGTHCGITPPVGGPSNWFEGNVIIGEDGGLWAGSDNYRMYGLTPGGEERVAFYTNFVYGAVWSAAATLRDGGALFGGLDMRLYSITAEGKCARRTHLGGLVSSTPALSDDMKTVYVGSWDYHVYALDVESGDVEWKYRTRDLIYGSPAVAEDGTVLVGSSDGSFYALSPEGALLWTYDTLDPIRSSPAVARDGTIFFGAGDGRLYALNADGTRAWSFDTTSEDRNDLNSSPALGTERVYLGGESGFVYGIPYSYCEENPGDTRCSLDAASDLPDDGASLYWVTPGGRSFSEVAVDERRMRGAVFTVRLLLREAGMTKTAGFKPSTVAAGLDPAAPLGIVEQAGGKWVNLVPETMLAADTLYTLTVSAEYEAEDGAQGEVSGSFTFRTVSEDHPPPDLEVGPDRTDAIEVRNMAPYQPPLVVSLNQIGFDSVDMIGSVIHRAGERFVLWLTAGRHGEGGTVIDPATTSMVALNGVLDGASFLLEGEHLELITGGPPIKVHEFRLTSQFDPAGSFDAGASVFALSHCLDMGALGLGMLVLDQCNAARDFVSVGTLRGTAYDGAANTRPAGVAVAQVSFSARRVVAELDAEDYPLSEHLPAIVLLDEITGRVVPIDYREALSAEGDAAGNLSKITLDVPRNAGIAPGRTRALVVADLFPLASVLWEE